MIKKCTMLVLALLVAFAAPAGAVRVGDPDDVNGLLDISLARFINEDGIAKLTLVTYDDWTCRHLRPTAQTTLKWLMDGRGDRAFDLVGTFECRQGTLVFDLRSTDGANRYEPVPVQRGGDQKTAIVRFPMDIQELSGDHITLIAKSNDRSGVTCESDCLDRAPDEGRLRGN